MRVGVRAAVARQRWWTCALPFAATTINCIDRNAAKFSRAAQTLTAARGLVVLGALLLHAGRPHAEPGLPFSSSPEHLL